MAGLYLANLAQLASELKAISASSAGLLFTGVDLINNPGTSVLVNINAITGGTGTTTVALTHSVDNTTFVAVPAAAILNPATGLVTTLSTFSTTGTNQIVAVNRELLRRYLRLEMTGTTITQTIAFIVIYLAGNTPTS